MKPIKRITVIGAGQMGHQIAMLCALGGYETILQDIDARSIEKAEKSLEKLMKQWVAKGKAKQTDVGQAFDRLSFTTSFEKAAQQPDLVIEAVVEKLTVKRQLFSQLEEQTPPHTIYATNSSTIVNSLIASETKRPDKAVNMHFFFPPLVMDCVEVVMSEKTSEETAELVMDVCQNIKRSAYLLRKEISGFVANRILGALQREAISLYEQGIADFQDIDLICKKALGHPLGPFELLDLSGNDVAYFVMQQQYAETGKPADQPPACIEEKVREGHLGRKTGKGWYEYSSRVPQS